MRLAWAPCVWQCIIVGFPEATASTNHCPEELDADQCPDSAPGHITTDGSAMLQRRSTKKKSIIIEADVTPDDGEPEPHKSGSGLEEGTTDRIGGAWTKNTMSENSGRFLFFVPIPESLRIAAWSIFGNLQVGALLLGVFTITVFLTSRRRKAQKAFFVEPTSLDETRDMLEQILALEFLRFAEGTTSAVGHDKASRMMENDSLTAKETKEGSDLEPEEEAEVRSEAGEQSPSCSSSDVSHPGHDASCSSRVKEAGT